MASQKATTTMKRNKKRKEFKLKSKLPNEYKIKIKLN